MARLLVWLPAGLTEGDWLGPVLPGRGEAPAAQVPSSCPAPAALQEEVAALQVHLTAGKAPPSLPKVAAPAAGKPAAGGKGKDSKAADQGPPVDEEGALLLVQVWHIVRQRLVLLRLLSGGWDESRQLVTANGAVGHAM